MSDVDWTTHCAEVTHELSMDGVSRNNLLVELWVMSGLVHECQDLMSLLKENIMEDSTVYQMIIERGIEQLNKVLNKVLNREKNLEQKKVLL